MGCASGAGAGGAARTMALLPDVLDVLDDEPQAERAPTAVSASIAETMCRACAHA
jgi:hypothetical protein